MPSPAPSSRLVVVSDADLWPFGLADLDGQRAAKFLAEVLRQLEDDPAGLLFALNADCRVLRALRELARCDVYSTNPYLVGGEPLSFQNVLMPLSYAILHQALEVSTLFDKVALVRDTVIDATANLVRQFLKCARAALNTRSLVAPMALEYNDDDAFTPMLKYVQLVAARDPEPAELNVVRTALKDVESLIDTCEPLVDMEGDDAFAAFGSPRAVELVRELLAKAEHALAAAVTITSTRTTLNERQRHATTCWGSSAATSGL
ncbi:hypothetical protein H9P43_004366 [Blastocladiella emersonii ATCC 22665]|nr:hypothetical protein H9P43_004366 [Blastocladiella emersonii ATCC 22665]